jgi:hypothetical protein
MPGMIERAASPGRSQGQLGVPWPRRTGQGRCDDRPVQYEYMRIDPRTLEQVELDLEAARGEFAAVAIAITAEAAVEDSG